MTWLPLSEKHHRNFIENLDEMKRWRPGLFEEIGDLRPYMDDLEILEDGDALRGVRIKETRGARIFFPPEQAEHMLKRQRLVVEGNLQRGVRLQILAGIGVGHAVLHGHELLDLHPRAAFAVFESNPLRWAAFLSLFSLDEIFRNQRLFLFGGNNAWRRMVRFIHEEYIYLLPPNEYAYALGLLPADAEEASRYIAEGKESAQAIGEYSARFETVAEHFLESMAQPLEAPPRSAWCCAPREAYIHFPLAQAFMRGFSQCGLDASLDPFDQSFTTNFRVVGHLFEKIPDLIFAINTPPGDLLQDIGIAPQAVQSFQRPRVCWMVDDTALYEDEKNIEPLPPNDYVLCIDRTYLSHLAQRTINAHFLPPAAMFEKPGAARPEFAAPISYVGSLPHVRPYLEPLPLVCREMIQRVEQERSRDYSLSFNAHFQRLDPRADDRQALAAAARAFCATTQKGFRTEPAMAEYFLYNAATYYKRKRIVLALLPLGLKIFGPDSWLAELPSSYQYRYGGFIASGDLADCYASARLSLNIHSHQCPTCLNPRDFDASMAGSVVLGDWVEDADRGLLQPGKEMLTFHSEEEAVETARRNLANVSALDEIRQCGRKRILREHTYAHRAQSVLQILRLRG
ncbi:MAG: glycosyltransferase [Candidatus Omnitrophota bacterium]